MVSQDKIRHSITRNQSPLVMDCLCAAIIAIPAQFKEQCFQAADVLRLSQSLPKCGHEFT
jgi:hypothetical protein